jgi:hypothetical protein
MKCPQCASEFPLTWERYFKAPLGKFACPSCGIGLVGKHTWFYWPLLVLACCILAIPFGYLGAKNFGVIGVIAGIAFGGLLSGIPIDKFLESKFSILKVQQTDSANRHPAGGGG